MSKKDYRELIREHEGFKNYVYLDSLSNPTVGWGHLLPSSREIYPGKVYSLEECIKFFEDDMQIVEESFVWLEKECELTKLDWVRRAVLKNMLFNLGLRKLLGFKRMFEALALGDYEGAAAEMLDSRWARQVKGRARVLARMMETGEWQT